MSCDREKITALVDDVLGEGGREAVEAHVAECASCRAQLADERALRARLRTLPKPELPFGLEPRVRKHVARRQLVRRVTRVALPLAAVLVLALWARGYAPFVAWELARDHQHCFGMETLPAQVWESDTERLAGWYREHGDDLPVLPDAVGGLSLVGGRYCPLPDVSFAPHLYYASEEGQVSVFLVPHHVRMPHTFRRQTRGSAVTLVRLGEEVLGIVSEDEEAVGTFVSRLQTSVAALGVELERLPAATPAS